MTTGKTIALTRWTFVGKMMSLLFNILSRFVISFFSFFFFFFFFFFFIAFFLRNFSSLVATAQFSSVQLLSGVWLCDPMDCSMPGLPVHHLLGFTQTHVHWVSDAIQPSYPLSAPSPSAFNISKHQDLFKWVSSLHQVAKVLEFQVQHQSFQWIFRTDFFRMDWLDLLAIQGTLKSLL